MKLKPNLIKLPFHKKSFCMLIGFILIAAFSAINNYYFYRTLENNAFHRQSEISSLIKSVYENCSFSPSHGNCVGQLVSIIGNAKLYGLTRIISNDEIVFERYTHVHESSRRLTSSELDLDNSSNLKLIIGQLVSPPLWLSTARSMSFSIPDWPGVLRSSQDPIGFAVKVAWPRSAPTFLMAFIIALVLLIVRVHSLKQLNFQINQQKKIRDSQASLLAMEEQQNILKAKLTKNKEEDDRKTALLEKSKREKKKVETELGMLSKEEASKKREKEKEIDSYVEILVELEDSLIQTRKENDKLRTEIGIRENEISINKKEQERIREVTQKLDYTKSQKRLVESILLESPDVSLSGEMKIEPGKHHSKDYIHKLKEQICNNKKAVGLIKSLVPQSYGSNKRGRAELFLEVDGKSFFINVYGFSDEGFSAKISLSATDHWEAIASSKYLINTIAQFKGVTFIDRTSS